MTSEFWSCDASHADLDIFGVLAARCLGALSCE
jgi:hypothetical protein